MNLFEKGASALREALAGTSLPAWIVSDGLGFAAGDHGPLLETARRLVKSLPEGRRPQLCVADRASNAITLAWEVTGECDPARAGSCERFFRDRLARTFDAWAQDDRLWKRFLLRRPSLLLLFAHGTDDPKHERADHLRRVHAEYDGLAGGRFPDVLVRWAGLDDWIGEIRRFHLRFFESSAASFPMPSAEPVTTALEKWNEGASQDHEFTGPRLVALSMRLAEAAPRVFATTGADASARPGLLPALSCPLRVRVKARRWINQPLEFSIHPVTLIASGNAGGKTSLAEALCAAHHGTARLRTSLPDGAMTWGDPNPSISLLSVMPVDDTGAPRDLASQSWLPLFADDVEVDMGRSGDIRLYELSGRPGVGAVLPQMQFALRRISSLAARLLDLERVGVSANGELAVSVEGPLKARIREGLRNDRSLLSRDVLKGPSEETDTEPSQAEHSWSPPSPHEPNATRTAAEERNIEADRARLKEIEKEEALLAEGRASVDRVRHTFEDDVRESVALPEGWSDRWQPVWADDARRWVTSPGLALLARRVRRLLSAAADEVVDAIVRYFVSHEEEQRVSSLADDLRRLLSPEVRLEANVRQNTADQIRQGHTARLAWALRAHAGRLPPLAIDEPTLAQDEASSARVMAQFLRLARHLDASVAAGADGSPVRLVEIEQRLGVDERPKRPRTIECGRDPRATLSPIVLLSYREQALQTLLEQEGTVVETDTYEDLGAMIGWWAQARIRELYEAWRKEITDFWPTPDEEGSSATRAKQALPVSIGRLFLVRAEGALYDLLRCVAGEDLPQKTRSSQVELAIRAAANSASRLGLRQLSEELRAAPASERPRALQRLFLWLAQHDLLAFAIGGDVGLDLRGVSLRQLSPGKSELKVPDLVYARRLHPLHDQLPEWPRSWEEASEPRVTPSPDVVVARAAPSISPGLEATVSAEPTARASSASTSYVASASRSTGPWLVHVEAEDRAVGERILAAMKSSGVESTSEPDSADVRAFVVLSAGGDEFAPARWSVSARCGTHLETANELETLDAVQERAPGLILKALVHGVGERLLTGGRVEIVATSNSPDEPGEGRFFRLSTLPNDAMGGRGESDLGAGIERLRSALQARADARALTFWLSCTLAVALRLGLGFHHQTGFSVECRSRGKTVMGDVDRRDGDVSFDEVVTVESHNPGEGAEIHLLVSCARDVRPHYASWAASGSAPFTVIEIRPREREPGVDALRGIEDVWGWAREARVALDKEISLAHGAGSPWLRVRIFIAAPLALAVALGRELNKRGPLALMDFVTEAHGYVTRFETKL